MAHAAHLHSLRLCTQTRPTGSPISNPLSPSPKPTAGPDGCRVDLFLANCSPLDADTSIDSRFMPLVRGERQPGRSSLSSTSLTHVRSSTAGTVLYPVVGGNPMMSTLWASSPMAEHAKIRRGGNQHPSAAPRVQSTKVTNPSICSPAALTSVALNQSVLSASPGEAQLSLGPRRARSLPRIQ